MNTKILMLVTAIYLGVTGIGLIFLPHEIASFFDAEKNESFILTLQILGSLYLGFGMMNWLTKKSLIGGIYNRQLVLGNLFHFLVSAFALIKVVRQYDGSQFKVILIITILYSLFSLCFGYLLKASPIK